jgi:hypothetical protein
MSRCPATNWAMCGGMPCMIASVMKILLKSCGTNRSDLPLASVIPVLARASLIRSRIAGREAETAARRSTRPAVGRGRLAGEVVRNTSVFACRA